MRDLEPYCPKRQYALNEKHCANPQPGDYWNEMFVPYLLVLERVDQNHFIAYTKTKNVPFENKWHWDTDKPEMLALDDLRKRVMYTAIHGFVADVFPNAHKPYVDEWAKRRRADRPALTTGAPLP